MKILVTGATGFIGSRLVKELSDQGHEIKALVFPDDDYSHIAEYVTEFQEGDISTPSTLRGIGDGIDVVYHLGSQECDDSSHDVSCEPIKDGTANMLTACAGVSKRFVYVSSIYACGTGKHLKGTKEDDPCVNSGVYYGDTRLAAEGLVRESAGNFADGFVIARPANMIGPRSDWMVGLGERIRDRVIAYIDGGRHSSSLIYIDNLVDGLVLCGTKAEAANRTYFFRDDWAVTWKQYLDEMAAMFDKRIRLRIPFQLAWFIGGVAEKLRGKRTRRKPLMTKHIAGIMGRDNDVDTTAARTELGWKTKVSYQDAMEEIGQWVKHNMWSNGIDDKVIVITGGSSGLGEALAKRLIKRGGCLALVARNEKKLLEVKKQLESENGASGQVEIFRCDVSQAEEVEKTFSAIAEKLGPPSILINSAGILREGYFENLPKDIFRQVMEINFFGALHCIQAIVPLLKKRGGGRVVNISSMAGLIGTFGYTPYCSSKYAVVGLTNALRTELKPQNISFNLVCPTEFDTPMIAEINKTRTVENDSVVHMIPTSTLDEVADAVIKGMEKDRYLIIPGFVTRMSERANRWFPRLTCVTTDSKIRKVYRGPDDSG